jgi:hypothetical protein
MVTVNPASATTSTYEKGNLYQISIADFNPDPDQPRKVIDPDALADPADWSEEDRRNAIASVAAFRDAADAFISALGEGGAEAGGTSPGPETT